MVTVVMSLICCVILIMLFNLVNLCLGVHICTIGIMILPISCGSEGKELNQALRTVHGT